MRPHIYQGMMAMGLLAGISLLTVLAGCSGTNQGEQQKASVAPTPTPASEQALRYQATFEPMRSPMPMGKPVPFSIKLTEQNQPVAGAAVEVHFEMEEMDHGDLAVKPEEETPGEYSGQINLPMAGAWQAYIRVTKGEVQQTTVVNFAAVSDEISTH